MLVIPILLFLILVVLLFGAARVKASIFRNLQIMAALAVLVLLWTTARSLPREFWWGIGIVAALGAAYLVYKFVQITARERAESNTSLAENGLTADEIARYNFLPPKEASEYHLSILQRNNDIETKARMIDLGLNDAEADEYVSLMRQKKGDEASALFLDAMKRKNAPPEPRRLNIHGY